MAEDETAEQALLHGLSGRGSPRQHGQHGLLTLVERMTRKLSVDCRRAWLDHRRHSPQALAAGLVLHDQIAFPVGELVKAHTANPSGRKMNS